MPRTFSNSSTINSSPEKLTQGNASGVVLMSKYCEESDSRVNAIPGKLISNRWRCLCGEFAVKGEPCPKCGLAPKRICRTCHSPIIGFRTCQNGCVYRSPMGWDRKYHQIQQEGEKVCTRCGERKHVTEFRADASRKTGRMNLCRTCHNTQCRELARKKKEEKWARISATGKIPNNRVADRQCSNN